jgi:hypothetical protein
MRLLNSADGLDDFSESSQFLAGPSNGHSGDLQQFSQCIVGCGPLAVEHVEDKRPSILYVSGGRHAAADTVI